MTQDEIKEAGEKAYKIERDKGNIVDVNCAAAYKLAWDAAVKLFTIPDVSKQRELLIAYEIHMLKPTEEEHRRYWAERTVDRYLSNL